MSTPASFTVITHAPHLGPKVAAPRPEAKAPPPPIEQTVPEAPLQDPSPVELARNVGKAASRWIGAGFPVVSQAVYDARTAACDGCELWDRKARLGLGKCKAPGCGCTSLKRWLATERCPHPSGPRWAA